MRIQKHRIGIRRYALVLAAALLAAYLAWPVAAVGPVAGAIDQAGGETRVASSDAPQGLSTGEWRSIEELAREAEYQITWHEATAGRPVAYHWAPNRAHGWEVAFHGGGVEVTPAAAEAGWRWGWRSPGTGTRGGSAWYLRHRSQASTPTAWRIGGTTT